MKRLICAILCFFLVDPISFAEDFSNPSTAYGTSTNTPGSRVNRARGTSRDPEHIYSGDVINGVYGRGYDGVSFGAADDVSIEEQASEDWTTTANGTKVLIKVTAPQTTTPITAMVVTSSGTSFTGAQFFTPGAAQSVMYATTTITVGSSYITIGSTGTMTLTGTPTLSTSTATNGQFIVVDSTAAVITVQDKSTLTNSGLCLSAATVAITTSTPVAFIYNALTSCWKQIK